MTTAVTQLALDQGMTNLALQSAQNATSILQSSVQSSLALKADRSSVEALALQVQSASSTDSVLAALIPYSTTTQINQAIAMSKGAIESTAAATYASQQLVTQLSVDVAAKTSQSDLATALQSYNSSVQVATAIAAASETLEDRLMASIHQLQASSGQNTARLDEKASAARVIQLASDVGGRCRQPTLCWH